MVEQYRQENVSWKYTSVLYSTGNKEYIGSTLDGEGDEIKIYARKNAIVKSINQIMRDEQITEKEAYYKYGNLLFEAKDAQSSIRTRIVEAKKTFNNCEDIISIEYVPKTGRNKGGLYEQFYKGSKCRLFAWLRDVCTTIEGVTYKKDLQGTYWDFTSSINNLTKEGAVVFPNGKKPESLISRIFEMATNPNDIVVDSFLGSGTTAAVAHKIGRYYIGIEFGNHAYTHCVPRMQKVVDGEQGGISKAVKWQGGGGFKFYELAPSLLNQDEYGNWIISKEYNPDMLAAAMAKQENFVYQPDGAVYWKQGKSTEKDFIFTTTQFVSGEMLDKLHNELAADETLLICATSFAKCLETRYSNIKLRKIPLMLLGRCEFGKDDYSLNIINLPVMDTAEDDAEESHESELIETVNSERHELF